MDSIFLAVDGQSKGPYTLAQVRESLAKGEASRDTPAWYQGLAEWSTLGAILDAAGSATPAAPPAPVPVPAAAASVLPGEFTKDELRHLCKSQNLLMYAVLAGFTTFFVLHIPVLGIPLLFAIAAFEIYALYQLATAMRMSVVLVVILCLCMFIPCVSLIILVIISARASKILKAHGVRIGIMGGNVEDLRD